jgi:hypothetical protein
MAEGSDDNSESCLSFLRERLDRELPFSLRREEEGEVYIPACDDVKKYLELLRSTLEYKKQLERIKRRAREPIEDREIIELFEESEAFKQLFWNFNGQVLHLSYNPDLFSNRFNKGFSDYIVGADESLFADGGGKDIDQMNEKDLERSRLHDEAARLLVAEGVVASNFIARFLLRAFLVDIGKDYISSARLSDRQRILRRVSDSKTVSNIIAEFNEITENPEIHFSKERVAILRSGFLKNNQFHFVEKGKFVNPQEK